MRPLVPAAATLLVALLSVGCAIYDPALLDNLDGATVDAGVGGDGGDCTPRVPPTRPEGLDDGVGEEMYFVIRDLTLRQNEGELWRRTGYDLDGLCTSSPTFTAECTNRTGTEDGEDGIDNVFGARLFVLFELTINNYQDSMQAMHEEGRNALVVGIRGWNGQPDDPRVEAWTATTVGSTSEGAGGDTAPTVTFDELAVPQLMDGPAPAPTWDGSDWTWLRSDSFSAGEISRPLASDDNAFVKDGVLVFDLPDRAQFLLFGVDVRPERAGQLLTSRVRLTSGVMTVRLDPAGAELTDGVLAGRWPLDDLFNTTQEVGVCPGDPLADLLSNQLAEMLDVRDDPPTPGDPPLPCNALSLGASFRATRIRVAGLVDGPAPPNVCADRPPGP